MDLPDAAGHLRQFKAKFRKTRVIPVCAREGEGIERLKELLAKLLAPTT
jgi:selenocysteine-specific translation elongation factor